MAFCEEFCEFLENLYRQYPPSVSPTFRTNYSDTDSYDSHSSSSSDNETSNICNDCTSYNHSHQDDKHLAVFDTMKYNNHTEKSYNLTPEDDKNPLFINAVKLLRHEEESCIYHDGTVGNEHMVFIENRDTGSDSVKYFALFGENKDIFLDSINNLKVKNDMDIIAQVLNNLKHINCDEEDNQNISLEFFTLQRDRRNGSFSIKNVTEELKQLVQLFERKKITNCLDKNQSTDFDFYYSHFCPKPYCQLHIFFIETFEKNEANQYEQLAKNIESQCIQAGIYGQKKSKDARFTSSDQIIDIVEMAKKDLEQYREMIKTSKHKEVSQSRKHTQEFTKFSSKIVEIVDSAKNYLDNLRKSILSSIDTNKEMLNKKKGNENISDIINEIVDDAKQKLESYKPSSLTDNIKIIDLLYSDVMNKVVNTAKNGRSNQESKNQKNYRSQNFMKNYDATCSATPVKCNNSQNDLNEQSDMNERLQRPTPDDIKNMLNQPIISNDKSFESRTQNFQVYYPDANGAPINNHFFQYARTPNTCVNCPDANISYQNQDKELLNDQIESNKPTDLNLKLGVNFTEADNSKKTMFKYSRSSAEIDYRQQHYESMIEDNAIKIEETRMDSVDPRPDIMPRIESLKKEEATEQPYKKVETVLKNDIKISVSEEKEYPLISLMEYQVNKEIKEQEMEEQPLTMLELNKISQSKNAGSDKILEVWNISQAAMKPSPIKTPETNVQPQTNSDTEQIQIVTNPQIMNASIEKNQITETIVQNQNQSNMMCQVQESTLNSTCYLDNETEELGNPSQTTFQQNSTIETSECPSKCVTNQHTEL